MPAIARRVPEENDLDRLFGTYLARIHWWSRNQPAHAFTMADLDIFKGVGRATRGLPGAEYHRAAKAVLPGLQEWANPAADMETIRNLKRAQHQLDAPVAAGRPFFDYAAFMLAEWQRRRDFRAALDASVGAMKTMGIGMLVELACVCLAGSTFLIGALVHFLR